MFKLAISGVLCFICAYLGIVGKNYYDKRCAYLKDFMNFTSSLRNGISYSQDRLPQIGRNFIASGNVKRGFYSNLSAYLEIADSGGGTREQIEKCFDSKYLSKADKVVIKDFFFELGKYDYDTQMSKLEFTCAQMKKTVEKAEKESKTTGNLLAKLGLILGIAIMIILA
ncbi:MAG: stage III sporulation protein AB [Clostridia bacterium]|nr:stage III sporulation protein AB [Clostridia bacterium]